MKAAIFRTLLLTLLAAASTSQGTEPYSIGQPTDEEQFYLELINRARANPTAEGQRLAASTDPNVLNAISFFNVNLTVMQSEFAALAVTPPLAFNSRLIQAARGHSQDMFANAFQGHTGSGGSSMSQRLSAAGYSSGGAAENVYSFAENVVHGHSGFQIDWGADEDGTDNGMQSNRGHRLNIHSALREVGIGIVQGSNTLNGTTVGPQLVTQNFANPSPNNQAFVTGVAYYDRNSNGHYDPGEGIGGLTVNVTGSSFHGITANSGGYAVPVPTSDATRTVTFGGAGLNGSGEAVISGGANVKLDFAPTYSPAVLSGPFDAGLGQLSIHAFTPVGGATSHELRVVPDAPVANDGAENLTRVTASTTGSYTPRSTTVKHAGTSAYRLAHPTAKSQQLTYAAAFLVNPGGSLAFRSRLRFATAGQVARVQVSTDLGSSWDTVFSQAGNGGAGEGAFQLRNVPLTAYEGREVMLRFEYALIAGQSFFPGTADDLGWFIDEISFTNLKDVSTNAEFFPISNGVSNASYTPSSLGSFLLAVRPIISGRAWPFGPAFPIIVTENQDVNLAVRHLGQVLINQGTAIQAGSIAPGRSTELVFEIHNTGNSLDLIDINAQTTGTAFSLHSAPAATVPPKSSSQLIVRFSPDSPGTHTGTIQINSSDPYTPLFVIHLSGTSVIPPPVIHTPPSAQLLQVGADTTLSVDASGIGLTYQWLKNGKAISGAKSDSLTLTNVKAADAALYVVRVTAGTHTVNSTAARLAVVSSPASNLLVKEGGSITLSCTLSNPAGAPPSFQWSKGPTTLSSSDKPKGFNTARLTISNATATDADTYKCQISIPLPASEGGGALLGLTQPTQLGIVLKPIMADPGFGSDFVSETIQGKYTLTAVNGVTRFTATGLPPGIKLHSATGELTGKPSAAKLDKLGQPIPYQVKLSASNLAGTSSIITMPWTIQPLPSGFNGRYEMLVTRSLGQNQNLGGHLSFIITLSGKITGTLFQHGKKFPLTGQLDVLPGGADAGLQVTFKRTRGQAELRLTIPSITPTAALSGTLSEEGGGPSASVHGWRCPFDGKNPTSLSGQHNLAFIAPHGTDSAVAPAGHGFATATLTAIGSARFSGILADGTSFTAAHFLGQPSGAEAAQLMLYAPLYAGTGSIQGRVLVNDLPGQWQAGLDGVDWLKLPQTKTVRTYTQGFTAQALSLRGARFEKPPANTWLTGLTENMTLEFRQGGLGSSEFDSISTLSTRHVLTPGPITGPLGSTQISGLKISLSPANGRVGGAFTLLENIGTPTQSRRAVKISGIVIPITGEGAVGHFQLAELPGPSQKASATAIQSGSLRLRQ